MPRIIAQNRIPRANIANRGITSKPLGAGGATPLPFVFPIGTWTFTAPQSGVWKVVQWAAGSQGSAGLGGNSGAYAETSRRLARGQTIGIVAPKGADTVVTFPDGTVVTTKFGNGGGTATGGDYMLNGSPENTPGQGTGGGTTPGPFQGGGAPGRLPFRGGDGGSDSTNRPTGHGAGGAEFNPGGPALVLVIFERD